MGTDRRDEALAKLDALPAFEETLLVTATSPCAHAERTEDRLLFIVEAANDRMQRPELYRAASEVVNELLAVRLHAEMAESALAGWKARAEKAEAARDEAERAERASNTVLEDALRVQRLRAEKAEAAFARCTREKDMAREWMSGQGHDASCLAVRDACEERPCSCGYIAACADEPEED